MSKSSDSDQARQNVGPDLDPNYLQWSLADDKRCHQQVKSLIQNVEEIIMVEGINLCFQLLEI